ncbi:unnamed protein product [Fraxinus pennsylvanica]|uniref:USP domain-containing protein n=1 Tax=Fraxinus pennsylvanica TaxID=56036 RepID=A0AAD2E438_9LAMI|nr:unnamed protein product [Fraxinus pennsylvanica]
MDYILLPEGVWNQLYSWYGGGPVLARKVIDSGLSQTELSIEVYPLRLQLHLMPKGDRSTIRISKKETIGELHRRACEIFDLIPKQVYIWDYYSHQKHALMNDMEKILDDANIQMDQDILVEVINSNSGGCVGSVQENGSADNGILVVAASQSSSLTAGGLYANKYSSRNDDYHQEINRQNPLGMVGELALAFGELLRKLWAPGRTPVAPRSFKAKLARFAPQFSGCSQHDSQELLAFLLDGLHEDLNRVKHKPYIKSRDADGRPDEEVADEYWANHIARNDSIIVDVCQGQYKSTLVCPVCNKVSVTFDPFIALPTACTVSVPKQGRCWNLIQALSNDCSLQLNEKLLLAEIRGHLIYRFLEDPLISLSSIKDDDHLAAYKIPKDLKKTKFLQLIHCRGEQGAGNSQSTMG